MRAIVLTCIAALFGFVGFAADKAEAGSRGHCYWSNGYRVCVGAPGARYAPGPVRRHGGYYASPKYYYSPPRVVRGHRGYTTNRSYTVNRAIVTRKTTRRTAIAVPPARPQVPPPSVRSNPGAIPVNTAQGIRYTGPFGGCTRSDGSPGRPGLSPHGEPACYRF